jgi:ribosomal protein S12 methylthiotransferase
MIFYLDPFGCAKNQVDAENSMALLGNVGWTAAEDPEGADLIIINSCGFIESAKRESINAVLAWRKRYPGKKILLAGCLAQRYETELAEILPEADGIFGNRDLAGIAAAAEAALGRLPAASGSKLSDRGPAAGSGQRPLLSLPGSAYVKIAEGCDNRWSFCAIPLIRGNRKSRPVAGILDECRTLLGRGIRELCLIGQDLGSYGGDLVPAADLPLLLEALSALEGDFWVRFLYIHPENFPPALPDLCLRDRRLLPYFDLPFQHGSTRLLRRMHRRGDAESYLELLERIRTALPGAVIRSTFMTGFPGETEEDFAALLDFQEKARLDWLGVFTYSREEDTAAYGMKNRVPRKLAAERKRLIEERQIPITEENMDRFTGKEYDVLVEEKIDGEEGVYLGRLYCQAPEVDGFAVIHSGDGRPLEPGTFVKGRVSCRSGIDLQIYL